MLRTFVTLAVFACCLFQVAEMNPEIYKKCVDQERVDVGEFQKLKGGRMENPSQNFKCFNKCFLENVGIISGGRIDENKVLSFLNELPADKKDKSITAFNRCKTRTGSDDCDTAYQYMACMGENVTV